MDKIVFIVAKKFKEKIGKSLVSIIVHGSYAQDNAHKTSDIDYFFVLRKISFPLLLKIRQLKIKYEKEYKKQLSINIQKLSEMPSIRKHLFYHKNRYALFLHEVNKIDKVIIGINPYQTEDLPAPNELKVEAIKIINSFAYFLRKFFINSGSIIAANEAIRYVIMATQYANAFVGDYPTTAKDSVTLFLLNFKDFKQKKTSSKFFKLKKEEIKMIDENEIIKEAISFLEHLDEYLFNKYLFSL